MWVIIVSGVVILLLIILLIIFRVRRNNPEIIRDYDSESVGSRFFQKLKDCCTRFVKK